MDDSFNHIDQYFNEEMTPDEKKLFEERCLADQGFAREVKNYILMRDQAKALWVQQKKQEFAEPGEEEHLQLFKRETGKIRTIKSRTQLAVAASIVVILTISVTLFLQYEKNDRAIAKNEKDELNKHNTNDTGTGNRNLIIDSGANLAKKNEIRLREIEIARKELVAKNFKLDAPPENTEGILAEAFNGYAAGNFKKANTEYDIAIAQLKDVSIRSGEDETEAKETKLLLFYAHYYSGLSYFADGNARKAIAELKGIKDAPDKLWQNKVQWYLALAYIKEGDTKMAETLLNDIAGSKNARDYQRKAAVLLDEIKSISKLNN